MFRFGPYDLLWHEYQGSVHSTSGPDLNSKFELLQRIPIPLEFPFPRREQERDSNLSALNPLSRLLQTLAPPHTSLLLLHATVLECTMDSDPEPKRPLQLSIDLNEDPPTPPCEAPAPPPSDPTANSDHEATPDQPGTSEPMQFLPYEAYMLACRFHGVVTPARGHPAEFPGEAGFSMPPLACGYCTRPELPGATMVCDGCERGFHLGCVVPPAMWHQKIDEWVCPECQSAGVPARKWSLAGGANPMLDMNAPPPSEAEGSEQQQIGILSRYKRHFSIPCLCFFFCIICLCCSKL